MTPHTLAPGGRILPSGHDWFEHRDLLTQLAGQYPAGSRVVHGCGREGTVAVDQPAHVPGMFLGQPTTVCLGGPWHNVPMVFVTWDNEADLVWRVWVPVAKLRKGKALAANRPGNTARTVKGGRR
ncbi:hypothetical protein [Streptomyces sp. NPDC055058]